MSELQQLVLFFQLKVVFLFEGSIVLYVSVNCFFVCLVNFFFSVTRRFFFSYKKLGRIGLQATDRKQHRQTDTQTDGQLEFF